MKVHPTRLAYVKTYFLSLVLFALFAILFFNLIFLPFLIPSEFRIYLLLLPIIGILLIVLDEIKIRVNTYTLTNTRIIQRKGLYSLNETFVAWNRVSSCSLNQSIFGRLMGIGNITIESTGGEDSPEISIKSVRDVSKIKQTIDQMTQKA